MSAEIQSGTAVPDRRYSSLFSFIVMRPLRLIGCHLRRRVAQLNLLADSLDLSGLLFHCCGEFCNLFF
jgi:hypothetical protein